jgi:hypothetical protein
MNLEEMKEIANGAAAREEHIVLFLPYLRLKQKYSVAGVDFVPLRSEDGKLTSGLESAAVALDKILSGYFDRHGKPLQNCAVAAVSGKGWDIDKSDFPAVRWAASLLFLASWSCNSYYGFGIGNYVNSGNFRLVGQGFRGSAPVYIAISTRRRDGSSMDGGYKHGEFKFSLPLQVSIRERVSVDERFLSALDAAHGAGAVTVDRLRTALPFVELANTDDEFMTEHNEAILMASAFEQLFDADAKKYALSTRFGDLFGQFGSVTVADAMQNRPGISIDKSDPARAAAQPTWWVHKKWIEELYDVRSKVVHKDDHKVREAWGWDIAEHLVMAAHVLPLVVKLMLENEGHYKLSDDDRSACLATDPLLVATQWVDDRDERDAEEKRPSWQRILSKSRLDMSFDRAMEKYRKEHPEAFADDSQDESPPEASTV